MALWTNASIRVPARSGRKGDRIGGGSRKVQRRGEVVVVWGGRGEGRKSNLLLPDLKCGVSSGFYFCDSFCSGKVNHNGVSL